MKIFIVTNGLGFNQGNFLSTSKDLTDSGFRMICDGLLPRAAEMALALAKGEKRSVWWSDVINCLVEQLIMNGFDLIDSSIIEIRGYVPFEKHSTKYLEDKVGVIATTMIDNNQNNRNENWKNVTDS